MTVKPYPLKFEPIVVEKVWGGHNLERLFGRALPANQVGETWEVADLENGQSVVSDGPAKGKTLGDMVRMWGDDLLGGAKLFEGRFPLLIKFLDAEQNLSVQVHPDERMARKLGGNVRVKHEAWYIVEARGDAAIYVGLADGVGRDEFVEAIEADNVERTLRRVPVEPGDCYYLPSGTLHALGHGVVVAEIQTPSDITYRVYDWGRQGRTMHIKQALECINFDQDAPPMPSSTVADDSAAVTRVVECESFLVDRIELAAGAERQIQCGQMAVWIVLSGSAHLVYDETRMSLPFTTGDVLLVPAGLGGCYVLADSPCQWLCSKVPVHGD